MSNFELADHPVYDGGELQWFDDEIHGTGMLAYLFPACERPDPLRPAVGSARWSGPATGSVP